MLKNLIFLKLLAALLQGIASAFHPVTENNRVLVGHVIQQLYTRDWFNCIQACHDEPRCVSYNYDRSAGANGLCELNDCGVKDLCDRDKYLIYSNGFVFQQLRDYKSCKQIKNCNPAAVSGVQKIYPLSGAEPIEVYCEQEIAGDAFTFLPGSLTRRSDAQQIVDALFQDKKNVLLKLQKNISRSESYTLIQPHPNFNSTDFGVLVNSFTGYTRPQNYLMKDYIFFGIIPKSETQNNKIQGFKSNGKTVQFNNCGSNATNSLFAFMPNHNLQTPSSYHNSSLVYESSGVAVDWRSKATPITHPDRMMPNEFFFLTELHFGGCGCYTSSDRWKDGFNSTAIGIR